MCYLILNSCLPVNHSTFLIFWLIFLFSFHFPTMFIFNFTSKIYIKEYLAETHTFSHSVCNIYVWMMCFNKCTCESNSAYTRIYVYMHTVAHTPKLAGEGGNIPTTFPRAPDVLRLSQLLRFRPFVACHPLHSAY